MNKDKKENIINPDFYMKNLDSTNNSSKLYDVIKNIDESDNAFILTMKDKELTIETTFKDIKYLKKLTNEFFKVALKK